MNVHCKFSDQTSNLFVTKSLSIGTTENEKLNLTDKLITRWCRNHKSRATSKKSNNNR